MPHYKRMLKATSLFRLQIALLETFLVKAFDPVPSPQPTILQYSIWLQQSCYEILLLLLFYRASQTPTMVTNHITTDHKASAILGSDTKAAPISYWEGPKAAIAVFEEGGVEKGRTRLRLHKHLLPEKPHSMQAWEHHNERVSCGEKQREHSRLGSFSLHPGMHPLL